MLENIISEIEDILLVAANAIMDIYQSDKNSEYDIELKSDMSPLTKADLASNDIISTFLRKKFPLIPIISEESEIEVYENRKNWEYVWLLDPLDGTKEFIRKSDEFSINLALIHNNQPIAGFIYLPVYKKLYYAIKGQGAFEVMNNQTYPLHVKNFTLKQKGLKVIASRSLMDDRTKNYINVLDTPEILFAGSALKFISIAKGEADYYPRMIHIMEWDTAAGQIIIEEAGGALVDAYSGLPLTYNKSSLKNPHFIASGKMIEF